MSQNTHSTQEIFALLRKGIVFLCTEPEASIPDVAAAAEERYLLLLKQLEEQYEARSRELRLAERRIEQQRKALAVWESEHHGSSWYVQVKELKQELLTVQKDAQEQIDEAVEERRDAVETATRAMQRSHDLQEQLEEARGIIEWVVATKPIASLWRRQHDVDRVRAFLDGSTPAEERAEEKGSQ